MSSRRPAGVESWADAPDPHAGGNDPYAESVDPSVSCSACDAVCCRLTVVLMPEDRIPAHLTETSDHGLVVMARGEDGWCVAVDPLRMCCTIYEDRPSICRKFAMGSPYCRDERSRYKDGAYKDGTGEHTGFGGTGNVAGPGTHEGKPGRVIPLELY